MVIQQSVKALKQWKASSQAKQNWAVAGTGFAYTCPSLVVFLQVECKVRMSLNLGANSAHEVEVLVSLVDSATVGADFLATGIGTQFQFTHLNGDG